MEGIKRSLDGCDFYAVLLSGSSDNFETSLDPMSGFSTFAICGVGKLGSRILSALLEHPAASSITIRVLTRPGSPRPPITGVPTSVTFWPIDYTQPALADAQLVKALTGVEVVISAVGSGLRHGEDAKAYADAGKHIGDLPGFKSQRMVAHAAKKAGCQLFVPASVPVALDEV